MNEIAKEISIAIFTIKCALGAGICYYLQVLWNKFPFDWAMVSVALAMSFDNSNQQAVERTAANLIGCTVGLLLFLFPLPYIISLLAGIVTVVVIGLRLGHPDAIRPGLAAFLIVMIEEERSGQWFIPLERVLSVMIGCFIAFLLTIISNSLLHQLLRKNNF